MRFPFRHPSGLIRRAESSCKRRASPAGPSGLSRMRPCRSEGGRMKRAVALVLGIALAAACRDERLVQTIHTPGISAVVVDGAHSGDPDLFVLPPLVPDPSGDPHFVAAQFDGTLSPTVEVCELTGDQIGRASCRERV